MPVIQCGAVACRYNGAGLCQAGNITVTPLPVEPYSDPAMDAAVADTAGSEPAAGYALEFASYADFAAEQNANPFTAAICTSFQPG